MAYGIIRVRNLHQSDLKSTQMHNAREFEENERPSNVIAGGYSETFITRDADNLGQAIEKRYEEAKVKQRSDSIVALEYVVSLSPEAMTAIDATNYSLNTILEHLCSFVKDKHGDDNVIAISKHYDESNPHAHIIVTPIISKDVRWKNTKGEGVRTENRLCARDFIGDKDKLRQLQTDYYQYITTMNNGLNIAERFPKIKFERGVDARDKRARKEYYSKMTNHVLGGVRKELENMKKLLQENKLTIEEFDVRKNAIESKISTISANIEKKADKDLGIYKKAEKWAKNSKDLGL